jgi:EndoU nuclease-like protein
MRPEAGGVDRPFDAGAWDAGAERLPRQRGSGEDADTPQKAPAELRTRAEYYEALRAAGGGSGPAAENDRRADTGSDSRADSGPDDHTDAGSDHRADAQTERSGWDAVDAEDRPAPDAIHISPDRSGHILDGDKYGGGHRHGTGRPGKTEFPASWDDQKIVDAAVDIARKPDQPPVRQDRNNRWICVGTRDSVEVSVIVLPGGDVWTAWPEEGSPGVVRNPRKGTL